MPGPLDHSPADVLAQALIDLGHASDPDSDELSAWPCYVARRPDKPDELLCCTDTSGRLGGKTQPDGETQAKHGVQVYLRSRLPDTGYAKLNSIMLALDTLNHRQVAIDGSRYVIRSVSRSTDMLPLGQTETTASARHAFTLNLLLTLRQLPL